MILSLAACGDEQATRPSAGKPSATTSVQPSGKDALTIEVQASAQAPAKTWKLSCEPASGDHPKAEQACATLSMVKEPFKPTPPGQMCTKIYGGPEIATVKGTWRNERINTKFTRADGCELRRWSNVAPLFGDVPKVR
jgi:hypothetical protein